MKTYSAKPKDVTRAWHIVDASEAPLGRIASEVATLLMGKHKPMFTSHIDCGDWVVIINADSLVVTGGKEEDKMYYRHSGYAGGLKERTLREQRDRDPSQIMIAAIRGMMPANKLRDERLKRLKVYAGSDHKHDGQQPVPYKLQYKSKKVQ